MGDKKLARKPLVEALLEIRFVLPTHPKIENLPYDKDFALLPGKLHSQIASKYQTMEDLPIAQMPVEVTPHKVRYRFRVAKDEWPVIQIGPGIASFNATDKYTWEAFKPGALEMVGALEKSYSPETFQKIDRVMLRYINSYKFDYEQNPVLPFLKEKMGIEFVLPEGASSNVKAPKSLNIGLSYTVTGDSTLQLRISTGKTKDEKSIIWDIQYLAKRPKFSLTAQEFSQWLDQAHSSIEKCFFSLIRGALEREFE